VTLGIDSNPHAARVAPLQHVQADHFIAHPIGLIAPSPTVDHATDHQHGVRLHESVKVELETYARESDQPIVKPFLLVIARDTTHASELLKLIQSDKFFDGRYKDKVIQVDSSRSGAEEEEMIEKLLKVEHTDEPTEIVIHVNMLKEGWDVTNLYTIVPLRAANARVLIEQSIGRGLRLPFGRRTDVDSIDRLTIIAHDKFQSIIDEASKPDSIIRTGVVIGVDVPIKGQQAVAVPTRIETQIFGTAPVATAADGTATVIVPEGKPAEPKLVEPTEVEIGRLVLTQIAQAASRTPAHRARSTTTAIR